MQTDFPTSLSRCSPRSPLKILFLSVGDLSDQQHQHQDQTVKINCPCVTGDTFHQFQSRFGANQSVHNLQHLVNRLKQRFSIPVGKHSFCFWSNPTFKNGWCILHSINLPCSILFHIGSPPPPPRFQLYMQQHPKRGMLEHQIWIWSLQANPC